jgi:hypothetical protein
MRGMASKKSQDQIKQTVIGMLAVVEDTSATPAERLTHACQAARLIREHGLLAPSSALVVAGAQATAAVTPDDAQFNRCLAIIDRKIDDRAEFQRSVEARISGRIRAPVTKRLRSHYDKLGWKFAAQTMPARVGLKAYTAVVLTSTSAYT